MSLIKEFFSNLGFSFDKDFVREKPFWTANEELSKKLLGNFFSYKTDDNEYIKSSFYLITIPLNDEELFEVKRFIWNQDKYELFFCVKDSKTICLNYAKENPRKQTAKIDEFKTKNEDDEKIRKIQKWQFDSGVFWTNYTEFIRKIKYTERIDKKLVEQLKLLKRKLEKQLGGNNAEVIQALIDRMLFIKFLEDNHIINSYFYQHYFTSDTSYKALLEENNPFKINQLYKLINKIFSNCLFSSPSIEEEYIIKSSFEIRRALQEDIKTSQLRLFDFQFNVIPIEFISHIYEVFLEREQRDEGIYYTPPKLAHLIIDDVITEPNTILDPACGSGMFLILSYRKILQKLLPQKDASIPEIIEHRIKILQDFIFGIEKKNTAWRLTIFALYLEVLKDLDYECIKAYVRQKIESSIDTTIFPDFSKNIINGNSLEINECKLHFQGKTFGYIVGNPPFFKIKQDKDNEKELEFLKKFSTQVNNVKIKASKIVGDNQISQAFMLKIKDWANEDTKFGFIQNSSNFYNDNSRYFQEFFFTHYQVDTFYELSRVKSILFEKAAEPIVVTIFNNKRVLPHTKIKYYPVDLEIFSKEFNLLIVKENKRLCLNQEQIRDRKVFLRDYLVGNKYDLSLLGKLSTFNKLDNYLLKEKGFSFKGLERLENKKLAAHYSIINFNKLSDIEKTRWHEKFANENYLNKENTKHYDIPYIYEPSGRINKFKIIGVDGFMNISSITRKNFQRPRQAWIYKGKNILLNRRGNSFNAVYSKQDFIFSNFIYGIKLKNDDLYHLMTAIMNSDLIDYYITQKFRKRIDGNFTKIDTKAITSIPIPKELNNYLVSEIKEISKNLSNGKLEFEGEVKFKLNELIFDLYELGFYERQRIKDFFIDDNINLKKDDIKEYEQTLKDMFELYLEETPQIESHIDNVFGSGITVVSIYLNRTDRSRVLAKKFSTYLLSEEILKSSKEKFTLFRSRIIGNDSIYLIKNSKLSNWSITKAYEDAKDILESAI